MKDFFLQTTMTAPEYINICKRYSEKLFFLNIKWVTT